MAIYTQHKLPQYESKKCCFWCGKYSKHGEMVPNMILGKVFKCKKCIDSKEADNGKTWQTEKKDIQRIASGKDGKARGRGYRTATPEDP